VLDECDRSNPGTIVTTGLAPIDAAALTAVGRRGIRRINYLTDDPWNPGFASSWFFDSLPKYDRVFSPRRSNLIDLEELGCRDVEYLPFAFDPRLSYPGSDSAANSDRNLASDVIFVGGADQDRLPFISALCRSGHRVALYGDYWRRFSATRANARGHVNPEVVRNATAAAKVALCLVRRANRDGHVMRTFEIAATGTCA